VCVCVCVYVASKDDPEVQDQLGLLEEICVYTHTHTHTHTHTCIHTQTHENLEYIYMRNSVYIEVCHTTN